MDKINQKFWKLWYDLKGNEEVELNVSEKHPGGSEIADGCFSIASGIWIKDGIEIVDAVFNLFHEWKHYEQSKEDENFVFKYFLEENFVGYENNRYEKEANEYAKKKWKNYSKRGGSYETRIYFSRIRNL